MEILLSHYIHTMSHWSSGLPICFPSWGTWVQIPRGDLYETGILLLALSRYIGDPDMILITGFVAPSVGASLGFAPTMCKPEASSPFSGCFTRLCADLIISHRSSVLVSRSLQVLPASQPTESAAGREPCGKPEISLHSYHVSLVQWTTHLLPVMRDLLALSCYSMQKSQWNLELLMLQKILKTLIFVLYCSNSHFPFFVSHNWFLILCTKFCHKSLGQNLKMGEGAGYTIQGILYQNFWVGQCELF